ncbi:uncharacterized protein LOC126792100 [Argentina anserina]|uniref:uncharacterized protein LOC126792100 n=1 Tax=Argentina anserina TaxID=57926 RepID=UPI0021765A80|nr:uncharacterized protein LOC126792100 [Potentilla anserina]
MLLRNGKMLCTKLVSSTCVNMFSWVKPPEHCFKINVDGTRSGHSSKIAWGMYYGLKLARDLNISNIEIEADSAILINLLQRSDLSLHPLGSLITDCHHLLSSMDNPKINHVFRECNMTADSLAKNSIKYAPGLIKF